MRASAIVEHFGIDKGAVSRQVQHLSISAWSSAPRTRGRPGHPGRGQRRTPSDASRTSPRTAASGSTSGSATGPRRSSRSSSPASSATTPRSTAATDPHRPRRRHASAGGPCSRVRCAPRPHGADLGDGPQFDGAPRLSLARTSGTVAIAAAQPSQTAVSAALPAARAARSRPPPRRPAARPARCRR